MKKLVIFLFVFSCISAAFAEEAKKDLPLKVGVTGSVYGTSYKTVAKDVNGSYTAARMRPLFTFDDGNIEAVLKLEYDATFGAGDALEDKSSEYVGLGADKKGLEVANAYVKTKVDAVAGLTLTGGISGYDFPLIWGDNAAMVSANYAVSNIDLSLYYVKPAEGSNKDPKDDSQIYIADAKIKFGESSVRPAVFAYQVSKSPVIQDTLTESQFKDSLGLIYGLNASLVMGTMGLDFSGAYIGGKDKVADVKYSAYAFDFAPYVKVDPFKVSAFVTMVSGDNNSLDAKENSFLNSTISGNNAGINNWRLYIIEDGGSFTSNCDVANARKYTNTNGYLAFGLAVDGTLGPLTAKLQGAYAQKAKVGSGEEKALGFEVDANVSYPLTKTSNIFVEAAYLQAGKAYGPAKQNAQYINLGMTYSI